MSTDGFKVAYIRRKRPTRTDTFLRRGFFGWLSQVILLFLPLVYVPQSIATLVRPLPLSLAATHRISFDFSSSPYLDVSVREVPLSYLFDSVWNIWFFIICVPTFGNLRVIRLFAANRSLSQLVTSFFGSRCQGIHHMLFIAWTFLCSPIIALSFVQ